MLRLTIEIDAMNTADLREQLMEVLFAVENGYTVGAKAADDRAYSFGTEQLKEERRAA